MPATPNPPSSTPPAVGLLLCPPLTRCAPRHPESQAAPAGGPQHLDNSCRRWKTPRPPSRLVAPPILAIAWGISRSSFPTLLFDDGVVTQIISVSQDGLGPPRSIFNMMSIKFNGFGSSKRGIVLWQATSIALIWVVWWERNARIFEDKARNSEYLWDSIFSLLLFGLSVPRVTTTFLIVKGFPLQAIPGYSARRSLFEHYVRTRAEEERKEKRAAQRAAIEGFKQLLEEASEDIDHKTDYQTFRKKWGDDPRFEALDRKDRELLLNERYHLLRSMEHGIEILIGALHVILVP
ncbi:Pre-mRNA-processing protein 40C [Vitis vinifera]|uniref:Pre-mRNA-processing protein 40C n=1 Tax=Vitis vinifera TaxID=29760 RepID=A0A438JRR0_VITVI|nr:Pre-mRNA-processing protein 40C [Vitis vinifera]